MSIPSEFLAAVRDVVGEAWVLSDLQAVEPYLVEQRGRFRGQAAAVVKPATTEQVAAVVRLCAEYHVPVVPQGGNTGLVAGSVSPAGTIVISTSRMNRIRAVDPIDYTMTVDAGCILADVQAAAEREGCLFPLSLGAEGTCQIGGNLSSNAGGVNVLRYGSARDLCLGLEVVLADGRVWNGMSALRKDNTGYALKHLFVGGEGTLGIITAAVLKLFPLPTERQTALLALDDARDVTRLLQKARAMSGDAVSAFELIARFPLELAVRHLPGAVDPFAEPHPWYVLVEFSTSQPQADLRAVFDRFLETAFEEGLVVDGVVAESMGQAADLWRMREGIPEAQKHEGASIKHDVSVPVAKVPEFLESGIAAVMRELPGVRPCPFGHVGDGNIHFNLTQPPEMDRNAFLDRWEDMNRIVHDIVVDMGGSISAEHGVGRLKVEEIARYKNSEELDLFRRVKLALDPDNIMNPGAIVPPGDL
jgi:FAD/FMN-containing dehydrogenase